MSDAACLAIRRMEPRCQRLRALARVASYTTYGDVLARYDGRIVDDVLPRRPFAAHEVVSLKHRAAVDARHVAGEHFFNQPRRDVPPVALHGCGGHTANWRGDESRTQRSNTVLVRSSKKLIDSNWTVERSRALKYVETS